ncbi:hypothetical protein J1N35_043374 [Gossypium stocksii]|uniref:Uncharacterized protein n=1 Tax=Gossypium stocksii TaxID=47602 RepID=A0A9D3U7I1_9ROSI|nr:hypothetical protein J1N35_043374 [Gossypium stocksii]
MKRNLTEMLPEWKANLVLHAKVVIDPMDLSQVDFDFLRDVSTDSLGFDVYNPKDKKWEDFQSKWKQIIGFFIPNSPKINGDNNLEELNDSEQILGEMEPT